MKNRTEVLVRKLMMNEILEKTWIYLMVDFICDNNRRNIGRRIGKIVQE